MLLDGSALHQHRLGVAVVALPVWVENQGVAADGLSKRVLMLVVAHIAGRLQSRLEFNVAGCGSSGCGTCVGEYVSESRLVVVSARAQVAEKSPAKLGPISQATTIHQHDLQSGRPLM